MRTAVALTLLLTLTVVAGCIAPDDDPTGTNGSPSDSLDEQAKRNETRAAFLADHPTACSDNSTCNYWTDMYHQYVVYDLDTYNFDVLIVPSATADTLSHTEVARQAVEAWRDGILNLTAPWFAENFTMDIHVAGVDAIPDGLTPNLIVLLGGVAPTWLVGIGLEPKQLVCQMVGQQAIHTYPTANHHGWERQAADCTGVGFTCAAINVVGVIGDEMDLYDLVAHEVGHCLGIGHVGDALDFRARYYPEMDIMSYHFDSEHVGCVSNLNARVLEGIYAHLMDRPEEEWLPRGSYYEFDPLDYEQYDCENP